METGRSRRRRSWLTVVRPRRDVLSLKMLALLVALALFVQVQHEVRTGNNERLRNIQIASDGFTGSLSLTGDGKRGKLSKDTEFGGRRCRKACPVTSLVTLAPCLAKMKRRAVSEATKIATNASI